MSIETVENVDTMNIQWLRQQLDNQWTMIHQNSAWVQGVTAGDFDKRLYAIYLIETYHYTLHNARNQALVGTRADNMSVQYRRYCFDHAAEETGHELMALHDLHSLGFDVRERDLPERLVSTEQLIAYLYWVASTGNPKQRLGYSFWAEQVYGYIQPLLDTLKSNLNLAGPNLTFLISHSKIDKKHAREVEEMLERECLDPQDWLSVRRVLNTTLELTGRMLDEVNEQYETLASGMPSRYDFLNH